MKLTRILLVMRLLTKIPCRYMHEPCKTLQVIFNREVFVFVCEVQFYLCPNFLWYVWLYFSVIGTGECCFVFVYLSVMVLARFGGEVWW